MHATFLTSFSKYLKFTFLLPWRITKLFLWCFVFPMSVSLPNCLYFFVLICLFVHFLFVNIFAPMDSLSLLYINNVIMMLLLYIGINFWKFICICIFVYSFIYSFIHSFIHSSHPSSVHSFIHHSFIFVVHLIHFWCCPQ